MMKKLLFLSLAVAASLVAQPQALSIVGTVQTPTLTAVTNVGTTGVTNYCYWVVAVYTGGKSAPSGPLCTQLSNATLSATNYNTIAFGVPTTPFAAPTGYDLLRTTSVTPPTGACACAVSTAQSGSPLNDQSNTLNAYTVSTLTGQMQMWYDLETTNTPTVKWNPNGVTSAIPSTKTVVIGPLLAADTAANFSFVADAAYKVAAFSIVFTTASASGTVDIEVLTGTTAPGSGTTQLTGTVSTAGVANTVTNGTVIASPNATAAGTGRIGIYFSGTQTGLVGLFITITLTQVQ